METDDDIFIINKRAREYINKLRETSKDAKIKAKLMIQNMLCYPCPHGYTENDWKSLAEKYEIDLPSIDTQKKCTYKSCKDTIKECERLLDMHNNELLAQYYETSSKLIMDEYKKSINNVVQYDFMSIKRKEVSPEQLELKNALITLIENLFGIEALDQIIKRKHSNNNPACISNSNTLNVQDTSALRAENDQTIDEHDDEWNGMVYNDINRISFTQKFKYDKRQHFKETINQYQGLQHKNIPDKVYADILQAIHNHGLIVPNKEDPKEKFAKVTKEHIKMFLNQNDHSQHYEDLQLIYSKITTHPCPNIQKHEKALQQDFDRLVEVFLSLPEAKVDRKNFLNTHYVLRQLLKRRGINVPEDDLNNLKTPARIRRHDDIYQMCCDKLGWNFTPLAS
jgi:hypothetical protein